MLFALSLSVSHHHLSIKRGAPANRSLVEASYPWRYAHETERPAKIWKQNLARSALRDCAGRLAAGDGEWSRRAGIVGQRERNYPRARTGPSSPGTPLDSARFDRGGGRGFNQYLRCQRKRNR